MSRREVHSAPLPVPDPEVSLRPPTRELLMWLRDQERTVSVPEAAESLGRHPNSIRSQLDELIRSGLVTSASAPASGRGRPAMLYSASAAMHPDAHLTLVLAALADESADAQERAFAVGRRWAEGMGLADQPERLEQLLTQFGFRPERDGDVVRLRGCPWARAATEHPRVICTLHRGLSQAIVGDDRPLELVPFAGEHMCELRVGQQVSGG